jgi:cytochrome c oxidase subunit 1
MWIVSHFHTTVGTGVALSHLTASLLLIPLPFGRQLLSTSAVKVALALWFVGIMIFGVGGLHPALRESRGVRMHRLISTKSS